MRHRLDKHEKHVIQELVKELRKLVDQHGPDFINADVVEWYFSPERSGTMWPPRKYLEAVLKELEAVNLEPDPDDVDHLCVDMDLDCEDEADHEYAYDIAAEHMEDARREFASHLVKAIETLDKKKLGELRYDWAGRRKKRLESL